MSSTDIYSVLKGLGGATERPTRTIVPTIEITVLNDTEVFENVVERIYDLFCERWAMFHVNAEFPVERTLFVRYCYTAVKSRVSRVRNERFHTRCDDPWSVPTPIAAAIAGIGRVHLESPYIEIVPKWNVEHNDFLLDYDETRVVTLQLRAVERDEEAKLLFAHAISGDRNGDDALMALVPVRDAAGRLTEIQSRTDFDPIAGVVYLLMGLEPDLAADAMTLPTHPLLIAPVYIRTAVLLQQMHRIVEAGAA